MKKIIEYIKNKKLWAVCASFAFLFLCLPATAHAGGPNIDLTGLFVLIGFAGFGIPLLVSLLITLPFYIFNAPKDSYMIPAIINILIFLFILIWLIPGENGKPKEDWLFGVLCGLGPLIVACVCFYVSSGKIVSISYALGPALLLLVFLTIIMPALNSAAVNSLEQKLETVIKNKDIAQFNTLKKTSIKNSETIDDYLKSRLYKGDREVFEFLVAVSDSDDITVSDQSLVVYAVKANNIDLVKYLIEHKQSIDEYDPLYFAIYKNNKEMLEFLITNGANINIKNAQGETPLYYAIKEGNKELVEFLIAKGADVNAKSNNGETPLHYAVKNENKEIVEFLVFKGADVNAKDNMERNPIYNAIIKAAIYGDKEIAEYLISVKNADINAKDEDGNSYLHEVIEFGDHSEQLIDLLLSKGIDINVKNNEGNTPLHIATEKIPPIENGLNISLAKMEFLIKKGADVNAKNNIGNTPLHYACESYHQRKQAILLINNGAKINLQTESGWTPLMMAASNGSREVVELLLSKGANVNTVSNEDYGKETALYIALENKHFEIAKTLIEKGADVNSLTSRNYSSLMIAVLRENKEMVEFLIAKGADINIKTKYDETALDLAKTEEMKQLLISYGAKSAKDLE